MGGLGGRLGGPGDITGEGGPPHSRLCPLHIPPLHTTYTFQYLAPHPSTQHLANSTFCINEIVEKQQGGFDKALASFQGLHLPFLSQALVLQTQLVMKYSNLYSTSRRVQCKLGSSGVT